MTDLTGFVNVMASAIGADDLEWVPPPGEPH
jgi:hypothetical protein